MGISTTPTAVARLVRVTYEHFMAGQRALRERDWTTYGKEMRATQLGLERLRDATRQWVSLPRPSIASTKR